MRLELHGEEGEVLKRLVRNQWRDDRRGRAEDPETDALAVLRRKVLGLPYTRWCKWCHATYTVPGGKVERIESTRDIEPPAQVCVWAVDPGQRLPLWEGSDAAQKAGRFDPVVHECHKGKPGRRP